MPFGIPLFCCYAAAAKATGRKQKAQSCIAGLVQPPTQKELAACFLHFISNSLRHTLIVTELHGEVGTALRLRTQVSSITKHRRQGHLGAHALCTTSAGFHALHTTAATVQVTHHVAKVFFRGHHFHIHVGF